MSTIVLACVLGICAGCSADPSAGVATTTTVNALCNGSSCDPRDPGTARGDLALQPVWQWSRKIVLHISYPDGMGWASIDNGSPGDEVWIDRSFTAGRSWEAKLGDTFIPPGTSGWRTQMYLFSNGAALGQLRACGKAGNRPEISCTAWLPVCYGFFCDGGDPAVVSSERPDPPQSWVWYRKIALHMWDAAHMAWASIDNASPGDEVWIDRSWDGGATWNGKLGDTFIPAGQRGWRTWLYHFNDVVHGGTGLVRACGKASDRDDIGCTPWIHATAGIASIHGEAVNSMMARTTWNPDDNWWWSANALTALLEAMTSTVGCASWNQVPFVHARGGFRNEFNDDTLWWGLAWLNAYHVGRDLCAPGDSRNTAYLQTAQQLFASVAATWDGSRCGGGIPWNLGELGYKNTISNALFLKLAAGLYLHTRDPQYRNWAQNIWQWLRPRLRTDGRGLIMDDFGACGHPSGNATWTYNQGVIIGGLTYLGLATGDIGYLTSADAYANSGIAGFTIGSGIMHEDCEQPVGGGCPGAPLGDSHGDEALFKGIFVRNLHELFVVNSFFGRSTFSWRPFFVNQRRAMIANARSAWAELGFRWTGFVRLVSDNTLGTQISGVDLLNAAEGL